jgi:hypothetical protein
MNGQIVFKTAEVPKPFLILLNQVFEIEKKISMHGDPSNLGRNIGRIKQAMEELGLFYEDPLGQPFQETRTDLEATISGTDVEGLRVVEVIKPIIRGGQRDLSRVVQKGIVVVAASQPDGENK